MAEREIPWTALRAALVFGLVFTVHAVFGLPTVLVIAALVDCGVRAIERRRSRQPLRPTSADSGTPQRM